ncbi:hypothetical protein ESA94_13415 [Lacibacter luteus]|uniref:Uncharacterized protein n=1 Tax=Lacibacter luteus TaxID=2508719 RepID=A0A4Q1CI99_9BACT|nr:hypothetical protein [Lacibacter luteus]RXK60040.1 hypothetical protein ESA94_13415 [Lacibacter luteus]
MEGFRAENNNEKINPVSLKISKDQIERVFWGRSVDVTAEELVKVFAIISHIKEKGIRDESEIKDAASDLFDELDVKLFTYEMIFTDQTIDEIITAKEIDSITMDFNDIPIIIKKGSTAESAVKEWENAGYNSPEAIEKREAVQKEKNELIQKQQSIIDKKFSEIEQLDFSNLESVIDWLYSYNTLDIDGVDMYEDALVEKFETEGYEPKDNDAINGMVGEALNDKEKLGKVIIGYLLMNGSLALRGDSLKNSIEEWKKLAS